MGRGCERRIEQVEYRWELEPTRWLSYSSSVGDRRHKILWLINKTPKYYIFTFLKVKFVCIYASLSKRIAFRFTTRRKNPKNEKAGTIQRIEHRCERIDSSTTRNGRGCFSRSTLRPCNFRGFERRQGLCARTSEASGGGRIQPGQKIW